VRPGRPGAVTGDPRSSNGRKLRSVHSFVIGAIFQEPLRCGVHGLMTSNAAQPVQPPASIDAVWGYDEGQTKRQRGETR
jgi:hypothetical protein